MSGGKSRRRWVIKDYAKTVNSVWQDHHLDFYSQVPSYLVKEVRKGFAKRKPHDTLTTLVCAVVAL